MTEDRKAEDRKAEDRKAEEKTGNRAVAESYLARAEKVIDAAALAAMMDKGPVVYEQGLTLVHEAKQAGKAYRETIGRLFDSIDEKAVDTSTPGG